MERLCDFTLILRSQEARERLKVSTSLLVTLRTRDPKELLQQRRTSKQIIADTGIQVCLPSILCLSFDDRDRSLIVRKIRSVSVTSV